MSERFQGIAIPVKEYAPDEKALSMWASSLPESLAPFASEIANSVCASYVSFSQFVSALDESVDHIERMCSNRPKGVDSRHLLMYARV